MIPPKKIKNIARALLLPQKQDLVRASFNQSELAVWDLLCHPAGVGGLYEIPGSGKDQNRCLDMLQASGRKMRGVRSEGVELQAFRQLQAQGAVRQPVFQE